MPVRAIVAQEVARYVDAALARGMAPTVSALYEHGERLRAAELGRFRARLSGLDARQQAAVEALTRGIVAKLLHEPTVRLKDSAGSAQGERLSGSLRELFGLGVGPDGLGAAPAPDGLGAAPAPDGRAPAPDGHPPSRP